jgi:hypothetical protein
MLAETVITIAGSTERSSSALGEIAVTPQEKP